MEIKESLKKLPAFTELTDDELQAVADICKIQTAKAEEMVFREGDHGVDLFVIVKGCVRIFTQITENVEKNLITLREGGLFGELAVICEDYRTASAKAVEDTELIVINQDDFEKLIDDKPAAGKKILDVFVKIIADRLKNTTDLYRQAVDWGLSISGILELNYSQLISHRIPITIDLNSGQTKSGILLKADNNTQGMELLLEMEGAKLVMVPYGAISAISFDQPPAPKED